MRCILVVDDDPHICLAIRAWLKRYGFRVAIADGGVTGLAESIRIFHNRALTVPLIAISGYGFTSLETSSLDFLRMALKLGATRCLRKPFRSTTLLGVIDECLSELSLAANMPPLCVRLHALSEPHEKMHSLTG